MATDWEITSQEQGQELGEGGNFIDVMDVRFSTLPEGVRGVIRIPLRIYSAETVQSAIDQRVAVIKAVQAL